MGDGHVAADARFPPDGGAAPEGRAHRRTASPARSARSAAPTVAHRRAAPLRGDSRVAASSRSSRSGTAASCRPRFFWKHRGIVVITSQNFDGEWIARIIQRFGYGTARGSTSRGGARALVQLRRDLGRGRPAGSRSTVRGARHGSRSPARCGWPVRPASRSCRFTSKRTRLWTMKSWDSTQIPKPRSRVSLVVGEPIFVEDTSDSALAAGMARLNDRLRALEARALEFLAP